MKLMSEVIERSQKAKTDPKSFCQIEERTEWDAVEDLEPIAFGNKFAIGSVVEITVGTLDPGNSIAIAISHRSNCHRSLAILDIIFLDWLWDDGRSTFTIVLHNLIAI
jgi:hypothetical protein